MECSLILGPILEKAISFFFLDDIYDIVSTEFDQALLYSFIYLFMHENYMKKYQVCKYQISFKIRNIWQPTFML